MMRLRDTSPDELTRVRELEAGPTAAPFVLRWSDDQHRRAMSDPDQAHLAVERDGQMVGFVLLAGLRDPNRSVQLRRIVVSPAGQGLGRVALALVIDRVLGRMDAHRLWLDVKLDNHRAQRAYERAGFIREGVLRDALLTNGRYESLLMMSILAPDRTPPSSDPSGGLRRASRADFAEIVTSLSAFWGARDVAHLHHPTAIEEFGESALVIHDSDRRVAAYLFGMILIDRRLGYVHVVAVRDDQRGLGHARRLYGAFADLALARGCVAIKAITAPTNAGSIAFHRSIGMHAREVPDYSGPDRPRVVFTRELRR